jgi:hypothetical protein
MYIMLLSKKKFMILFSFSYITLVMRNPKGISHYMMTCSTNLFKHLIICYQTKPIGKCQHMIFNFYKSNDFFVKKKWSNIHFSYLFFIFMQNFKPQKKKLIMTCAFECFHSPCHISKRITWVFAYDGCHNHFWRNYFHI